MCLVPKRSCWSSFHFRPSISINRASAPWIVSFVVGSFVLHIATTVITVAGCQEDIGVKVGCIEVYINTSLSRWIDVYATITFLPNNEATPPPPTPNQLSVLPHHHLSKQLSKQCLLKPSSEPLLPLCPWLVPWWPGRWQPPLPHKLVM